MPSLQLPEKLLPFLEKPKRFKIAVGGRGGGKSQAFANLLLMKAQTEGAKILCLRELQTSIEDSVHSLLSSCIDDMQLEGFDTTQHAIRFNGDDAFKFKGMARNPDAVKSASGFRYSWCEEAQAISEKSLKMLIPTIREAGSELWFSMNPGSSADPMSKRFLKPFEKELTRDGYYEDDLHLIVVVNYCDNPFFPPELDADRIWDKENLAREEYDHIWMGAYSDGIENSLIPAVWFDSCVDAHKKLGFEATGAKYASHDPSDLGADNKSYVLRHGVVVLDVQEMTTGSIHDGGRWASDLAIRHAVDWFTYDADGMGVGLREQFASAFQGTKTQVSAFRGSESPDTPEAIYQPTEKHLVVGATKMKDAFRNKRAQYYSELRARMHRTHQAVTSGKYQDPDTLFSLSSEIDCLPALRSELCRIPIKPNGTGKLELYRKDEAKRLFKLPSPNMADALMMSLRVPASAIQNVQMPRHIRSMGRR